MKKTIYRIALLAGLVAASSLSAVAKPGEGDKKGPRGGGHGGPGGHDKEAFLEKFDTNENGKIDEDERPAIKAAMEERRAAMIAEHDTDGSGDLNEDEKKAMRAAMILKHFDADDSGDLDAEEQAKADAAMERRKKMHKRRGGKGGERGERGDKDGKRPEGKRKRPGHKHGDKKDDDAAGGEE